ncbi:cyclin-dependent kinase inhibitor 1-like [Myxocyprinus asiaticus]|uniref:cyclin-dependent kinase inhibitor 1-like n=1 Tax=Myxocyprinus asiaticus TaxID=70543 RepID=UPI00222228FE|nr:cyclin-dependent kinase inhibitor 1-like [Myxocyprinus asiaticus]
MSTVLFFTSAGDRLTPRKTVPQKNMDIFHLQRRKKSSETRPEPADILPLLKRSSTCRNLFGPVDHDELKRELTSKLREMSEYNQLRWNFNFSEGKPLDGDFKWEESPSEDCPAFYRETDVSKGPFMDLPSTERFAQAAPHSGGRSASLKGLKQENQADKCNPPQLFPKTVVRTKRLTTLRITDFYGKRRKNCSSVGLKESRSME